MWHFEYTYTVHNCEERMKSWANVYYLSEHSHVKDHSVSDPRKGRAFPWSVYRSWGTIDLQLKPRVAVTISYSFLCQDNCNLRLLPYDVFLSRLANPPLRSTELRFCIVVVVHAPSEQAWPITSQLFRLFFIPSLLLAKVPGCKTHGTQKCRAPSAPLNGDWVLGASRPSTFPCENRRPCTVRPWGVWGSPINKLSLMDRQPEVWPWKQV